MARCNFQGATGPSRCKFWVAGPPPLASSKVGIQFSLFAASGERRFFRGEYVLCTHTGFRVIPGASFRSRDSPFDTAVRLHFSIISLSYFWLIIWIRCGSMIQRNRFCGFTCAILWSVAFTPQPRDVGLLCSDKVAPCHGPGWRGPPSRT